MKLVFSLELIFLDCVEERVHGAYNFFCQIMNICVEREGRLTKIVAVVRLTSLELILFVQYLCNLRFTSWEGILILTLLSY